MFAMFRIRSSNQECFIAQMSACNGAHAIYGGFLYQFKSLASNSCVTMSNDMHIKKEKAGHANCIICHSRSALGSHRRLSLLAERASNARLLYASLNPNLQPNDSVEHPALDPFSWLALNDRGCTFPDCILLRSQFSSEPASHRLI